MLQTTYKLQFPYSQLFRFFFVVSPQVLNRELRRAIVMLSHPILCVSIQRQFFLATDLFDIISDQR